MHPENSDTIDVSDMGDVQAETIIPSTQTSEEAEPFEKKAEQNPTELHTEIFNAATEGDAEKLYRIIVYEEENEDSPSDSNLLNTSNTSKPKPWYESYEPY
jgi:hypothetical protein